MLRLLVAHRPKLRSAIRSRRDLVPSIKKAFLNAPEPTRCRIILHATFLLIGNGKGVDFKVSLR